MITYITGANYEKEVLESALPVVLDFYADWCGPCKLQGMILEELEEEWEGKVKICKCNVDEEPSIALSFGVQSIPTLVFFRDGEATGKLTGVTQEPALKRMLGI